LYLDYEPSGAYSSPDGACLLLSYIVDSRLRLRAYHWRTFGSTEGIDLDCSETPADLFGLTSLVNRNSIHLVGLDPDKHLYHSVALDITKHATEFMFTKKYSKASMPTKSHVIDHKCLTDCHVEVWTRFPVVPAIQRQLIVSPGRLNKRLVFVTPKEHQKISSHFSALIHSFRRSTRKPTGNELKSTMVAVVFFEAFTREVDPHVEWDMSLFRLGEWLVDLLCLIPLHVAIAQGNQFIPLKDGIMSADWEKSILGAEVSRIIDSLSFGWYESVFQSYMISKVSLSSKFRCR
jgi:hypothetical protein